MNDTHKKVLKSTVSYIFILKGLTYKAFDNSIRLVKTNLKFYGNISNSSI